MYMCVCIYVCVVQYNNIGIVQNVICMHASMYMYIIIKHNIIIISKIKVCIHVREIKEGRKKEASMYMYIQYSLFRCSNG